MNRKGSLTHEHFMYRSSQDLGALALFIAKVFVRYILVTEEGSRTQKLASQRGMQLFINGKMSKYCRNVGSCRLASNDETSFGAGFERGGILCSLAWILANDTEGVEGIKIYPMRSIPRIIYWNWEWIFRRETICYSGLQPQVWPPGFDKGE